MCHVEPCILLFIRLLFDPRSNSYWDRDEMMDECQKSGGMNDGEGKAQGVMMGRERRRG